MDVTDSPPRTKMSANPTSNPVCRSANQPTTWFGSYHGLPGGWVRVMTKNTTV